jgi:hypothetical protein
VVQQKIFTAQMQNVKLLIKHHTQVEAEYTDILVLGLSMNFSHDI